MLSAVVSKSYPLTGSYKIVLEDAESDEEFDAIPVLPFKGIDGASSVRYVYEVGTNVLATQLETGTYCILGCLPISSSRVSDSGSTDIPGTDYSISSLESETSKLISSSPYSNMGEANYTSFEEIDLLPGDISVKAPGGSAVNVLRGGLVSMETDTSAVRVNGPNCSVDVESFRYSSTTAMGKFSVTDSPNGTFSMEFIGNPNPASTAPNIVFNISAEGDAPSMSLSLGEFGLDIKSNGDVVVRCSRFLVDTGTTKDLSSGSSTGETLQVNTGSVPIIVDTDVSHSSKTKGNKTLSTGGELLDTAGTKRSTVTVGQDPIRNPLVAVSPDSVVSKEDTVVYGSSKKTIGTSLVGGGGYTVESHGGDIRLESKAAVSPLGSGSVSLSSVGSFSKNLGAYGASIDASRVIIGGGYGMSPAGIPNYQAALAPIPGGLNPTLSGTCKFSALFTYLKTLHGLLDSHVHASPPVTIPALPVAQGLTIPTPVPLPPSSPAPVFSAALTPLAVAVESSTAWILEV